MPKGLQTKEGQQTVIIGVILAATGLGIAAGAGAAAGGGSFFVWSALSSNLAIAGGSLILSGLMTRAVQAPQEISSALVNGIGSDRPRRIIYGTRRVGGDFIYMLLSGPDNFYLNVVMVLASHKVSAIKEIYFDNELAVNASGTAVGKFAGYVNVAKKLTTTGSFFTLLESQSQPEFTTVGANTGLRFKPGSFAKTPTGSTLNAPAQITVQFDVVLRDVEDATIVVFGKVVDSAITLGWEVSIVDDGKIRASDSGGTLFTSSTKLVVNKVATVTVDFKSGSISIDVVQSGNSFTQSGGSGYTKNASIDPDGRMYVGSQGEAGNYLLGNVYQVIVTNFGSSTIIGQWDLESILTDSVGSNDLSLTGGWRLGEHTLDGLAAIHLRLAWHDRIFSKGLPQITVNVDGKLVREPRTSGSPDAFTSNAALICADWLTDSEFGFGFEEGVRVDDDALIAAADICDIDQDKADGTPEDQYTINAVVLSSEDERSVLKKMLTCMAGSAVDFNGKISLFAGAYVAPTTAAMIKLSDLVGGLGIKLLTASDASFNAVTGVFPDPDAFFDSSPYPRISNSTYSDQDGETVLEEINYPYITSKDTCQRLSKQFLERNRQEFVVKCSVPFNFFGIACPETVGLTIGFMGWNEKEFKIEELSIRNSGEDGVVLDLKLIEEASGIYDWVSGDATEDDLAPNTNLPDVSDVLPPEDVVLSSGTAVLDIRLDGTIFSRIKVVWSTPDDIFVKTGGNVEIQFRRPESGSDWVNAATVTGDRSEAFILDVKDGLAYDVRLRSVNSAGFSSDWVEILNHTVVGKTAAPEDVTGFSKVLNSSGLLLTWNEVSDLDLLHYEIQKGTVWDASGNVIIVVKANSYTTQEITSGSNTYLIKAIDTSFNESDTEDSVVHTHTVPNVTSFLATLSSSGVKLTWDEITVAAFPFLKNYEIREGGSGWVDATFLWSGDVLEAFDVDIVEGVQTYRIKAFDHVGNESVTETNEVFTHTITKITSLLATLTPSGVLLSWNEILPATFPYLKYYEIRRGATWAAGASDILDSGNLATTFLDDAPISGNNRYMVKMIDKDRNESPDEPSSGEIVTQSIVTPDVASVVAGQNDNIVLIEWPDVSYGPLAGYIIRFTEQGDGVWGNGTLLDETNRTSAYSTPAIPAGDWTILVKAISIWGYESVNAASVNITTTSANIILETLPQGPTWEDTRSNFTIAHYTGRLPIEDQTAASGDNQDVFDTYIDNPFSTSVYTSEVVTLDDAFEATTKVIVDVRLHPDETTGNTAYTTEVKFDGGSWETIDNNQITRTFTTIQWRVTLDNTAGESVLYQFTCIVDLPSFIEGAKDVAIAAGGTTINFTKTFPAAPRLVLTVVGATAGIATFELRTVTSFKAHVFTAAGSDDGGTIDWQATYEG